MLKTEIPNVSKSPLDISSADDFDLPFPGQLSNNNRWVILAELIPWEEFEQEYAELFSTEKGAPAKLFRMALGSLIIKEKLGISDRETVEQIKENPYLQYFIGLESYQAEAPFDASMLVHFRQRINQKLINQINDRVVERQREKESSNFNVKKKEENESRKNCGKLLLDATCAPADIKYPQDLGLLNEARQETEKIIDLLYQPLPGIIKKKPRTYRQKARKDYLTIAKQRKPLIKKRRQAIKKQLQYLKRNLLHIDKLIVQGSSLTLLSKRQYKRLLVVQEVARQQGIMFENNQRRIDNRIVSLSQPHVRPIVRGKAGQAVEFGAKLSASCFDGYVFLDHLSWENYNESKDFKAQIEAFRTYTGCYPESVHVDKIDRTQENRAWCKARGIRISGPRLGRPPKQVSLEEQKQAQLDERIRNEIDERPRAVARR